MAIHWHRLDLRLHDNRGLAQAGTAEPVVPVFVFDRRVLRYGSPRRVAALLEALEGLRAAYRKRGSDLVVASGEPTRVLPDLARAHGRDRVVWNRSYTRLGRQRDEAVETELAAAGFATERVHDRLCHEPGSITTNDGRAYAVFSYFWDKWAERSPPEPTSPPDAAGLAAVDGDPLPSLESLGFDEPDCAGQTVSQAVGRDRLTAFCAGPIYRYEHRRDRPAADATSRLSSHLRWGTLGPRAVRRTVEDARADAPDETAAESATSFLRQLAWREFYTHVLAAHPRVVTANYRSFERPIEWAADPDGLAAWKAGETGFPLVDAGMRQLEAEGFMHNRVRMVVASFLTKDLLVDWREGYRWFRSQLIDHDPANDSGGWQWAASTGTDPQPYFRVFNPTTQCERHDPEGEYVRRYVPELADAPTDVIHEWPSLSRETREQHAPAYPAPILDHQQRRREAIEVFETARG